MQAAEPKHLPVNRWFRQITAGVRIFNEHLVFDAVEPSGVTGDPYYFGTTRQIGWFDFGIDPPRVLRLP